MYIGVAYKRTPPVMVMLLAYVNDIILRIYEISFSEKPLNSAGDGEC